MSFEPASVPGMDVIDLCSSSDDEAASALSVRDVNGPAVVPPTKRAKLEPRSKACIAPRPPPPQVECAGDGGGGAGLLMDDESGDDVQFVGTSTDEGENGTYCMYM